MIKKIITNLDLSKVFDHDCIPVVVLNRHVTFLRFFQDSGFLNFFLQKIEDFT